MLRECEVLVESSTLEVKSTLMKDFARYIDNTKAYMAHIVRSVHAERFCNSTFWDLPVDQIGIIADWKMKASNCIVSVM